MKTIKVAAAVICKDGKIFAARRGYGEFKHQWEFPGGKIEAGETAEQALAREIREELGAEIEIGEKYFAVEYDYPDFHLSMDCFVCSLLSEKLILKEHENGKWLARSELETVNWLPADSQLIGKLQEEWI